MLVRARQGARPFRGVLAAATTTMALLAFAVGTASAAPASYALVGPRGGSLVVLQPGRAVRTVPFAKHGQAFGTAVAPDGRAFVADGANGRLDVLDLHTGRLLASKPLPRSPKDMTVLTPHGRYVLAVGFGFARLYAARSPYALAASFPGPGGMAAVVAPDGARAYVAGLNRGGIDVLDLRAHRVIATLAPKERFVSLALSPGGRRLWAFSPLTGDVLVFGTRGDTLLKTLKTHESGFNPKKPSTWKAGFMQSAMAPGGGVVYAAAFSGHVDRFDGRTPAPLAAYSVSLKPGGPNQVVAVAVSPDGRRVFASDENVQGTVELSARTGRVVTTFPAGTDSRWTVVPASAVAPSPSAAAATLPQTGLPGGRLPWVLSGLVLLLGGGALLVRRRV